MGSNLPTSGKESHGMRHPKALPSVVKALATPANGAKKDRARFVLMLLMNDGKDACYVSVG